jgi:hypothetical protein
MKIVIKIRKSWGDMNPVTKRIDSKKVYTRKKKYGLNWEE